MARVQGNELLLEPQGRVLVKVDGAQVTIYMADGETEATIWSQKTGSTTVPQPLTTENGMVVAPGGGAWWLDPGVYVRTATLPATIPGGQDRELDPVRLNAYSAESVSNLPINARDLGAVGDGTTHPLSERFSTLLAAQVIYPHAVALTDQLDWAAIQAVETLSASSGRQGEVPGGTYLINRDIIKSTGARLRGAGDATRLRRIADINIFDTAFDVADENAAIALTADAAHGDATIELDDTTGLAAGQMCRIQSDVVFDTPDDPSAIIEGELARIKSVDDATHVTFHERLYLSYATADNAELVPVEHVSDISIESMVLEEGHEDATMPMVRLNYVFGGMPINHVRFVNHQRTAILVRHCLSVHLESPEFQGGGTDFGYGVEFFQGSRGCTVMAPRMDTGRHCVTTGGSDNRVPPLANKAINGYSRNTSSSAFDTHDPSILMQYIGCTATGAPLGYSMRGLRSVMQDCNAIACDRGARVYGAAKYSTIQGGLFDNMTGGSSDGQAIVLLADNPTVKGVSIRDTDERGIWVDCSGSRISNIEIDNPGRVANAQGIQYKSGTGHVLNGVTVDNATVGVRHEAAATIEEVAGLRGTATTLYARGSGAAAAIVHLRGTGSPEGAIAGAIGSTWTRTDGGAGTVLYVKESSPTATTGWVGK